MTKGRTATRIAAISLAAGIGLAGMGALTSAAGASTKTVKVTEDANKLVLAKTTWAPGKYVLVVTNKSGGGGTFHVSGPGVSASKSIGSGKTAKVNVTLKSGSYTLNSEGKNTVGQTVTVSSSSSSSGGSGGYGY